MYQRGVVLGFFVFVVLCVAVSAAAYAAWGDSVMVFVLANVGLDGRGTLDPAFPTWLRLSANVALFARMLTLLPLVAEPPARAIQGLLHWQCCTDKKGSCYDTWCEKLCVCLTLALFSLVAWWLQPFIVAVETFSSSYFKSFNAVVIPCLGYVVICRKKLEDRPLKTVLVYGLAVVGAMWGFSGIAGAFYQA